MLGHEITEPPDVYTDHAVVPRVSDRWLCENELKMFPRGSQLCAARLRKRMRGSSHRDEQDSCKLNDPESIGLHVNDATNRNIRASPAQRTLDLTHRINL